MAKIVEDMVAIKISILTKDNDAQVEGNQIITDDIASQLEAVAQELVGKGAIVEVVRS